MPDTFPASVLIVRVGAMGDILHALPAVTALRRLRPGLEIGWVVDPRWAPLLAEESGRGPAVSRLHLAETRRWSRAPWSPATWRSVLGLRGALRAARYGAAADLQGTLRSAVLGRFAGAQAFGGYADPRESAARLLYRQKIERQGTHVVEQGAALLGAALGIALAPARTVELPRVPGAELWAEELWAKELWAKQEIAASVAHGRRFVLLAPGAGWGAKQWPAERFGALAIALQTEGFAVLVNAAHPDDPVAVNVVAASRGTARAVCGGVAGLVALTRRAALVVGGDSGPVHLAAALRTPLVALFGPTDPARNGPWGAGRMRVLRHPDSVTTYKRTAVPEAGLARLTVEAVLRAALDVIEIAFLQE